MCSGATGRTVLNGAIANHYNIRAGITNYINTHKTPPTPAARALGENGFKLIRLVFVFKGKTMSTDIYADSDFPGETLDPSLGAELPAQSIAPRTYVLQRTRLIRRILNDILLRYYTRNIRRSFLLILDNSPVEIVNARCVFIRS